MLSEQNRALIDASLASKGYGNSQNFALTAHELGLLLDVARQEGPREVGGGRTYTQAEVDALLPFGLAHAVRKITSGIEMYAASCGEDADEMVPVRLGDIRTLRAMIAARPDQEGREVSVAESAVQGTTALDGGEAEPSGAGDWLKPYRDLIFAARTSGGTAGPDDFLMQACAKAEAAVLASPTPGAIPGNRSEGAEREALREALAAYDATVQTCPLNSADARVRLKSSAHCAVCGSDHTGSCGREGGASYHLIEAVRALAAPPSPGDVGENSSAAPGCAAMSEAVDQFEPDDLGDCQECSGEGGWNSCMEDCCPMVGGEEGCTDPRCWRVCPGCRGRG